MKEIIASCGIKCHECPAYIATKENNDTKRAEVAKLWSKEFKADIKLEDINCHGCHATDSVLFNHCRVCEIRKCSLEKKLDNCAECEDYSCKKLEDFFNYVPDAKITLDKVNLNLKN